MLDRGVETYIRKHRIESTPARVPVWSAVIGLLGGRGAARKFEPLKQAPRCVRDECACRSEAECVRPSGRTRPLR